MAKVTNFKEEIGFKQRLIPLYNFIRFSLFFIRLVTETIMTDPTLQYIFEHSLQTYFPSNKYRLEAVFYPSKSTRHTVELKNYTVSFRIAQSFRGAPERILTILGIILLGKLFRVSVDRTLREEYRRYVQDCILPGAPTRHRQPSSKYKAKGRYYDLNEIFQVLNRQYFNNQLQSPILGWSLQKSYRRLGFFSSERNLLVISRIFDSASVPRAIVEYLMYHEMLHLHFPTQMQNGRRYIHHAQFRKCERQFPGYTEIQNWLRKNNRWL